MTTQPGDDKTRLVPPVQADSDGDDATMFKPLHPGAGEGTASSSSRAALSRGTGGTWRRVADIAQGEHVGVGTLLKGRFLMERELGRGGMGVVYLARDERKVEARDRNPHVAVKVLNPEFRKHPDALIALQRESRKAQHLGSEHIVRVYDFDKDGANVFMTMEYVEGDDLRTLIRTRAREGMPFDEAWPLISGMAQALARAHEAGIVHSDFKPGNVMVTPGGIAKVFDFGIARAGNIGAMGDDDHTVFDASTLGAMTPAYASLQMLQGKPPTPSDDVYAFACVVIELLTGRHPFDKQSAEEAATAGRSAPVVRGLDKRQNKALSDALAASADARPGNVLDVLAGLRRRRWRERAAPWLAGTVLAAVVGITASAYVAREAEHRHVADTLRRFMPGQVDGFRDEDDVRRALAPLDADERRHVAVDGADAIDDFLVRRVNEHWNPSHDRFDYAAAQGTFRLRSELKTFAPHLDHRREEVAHERDEALNRLDTALSQAVLSAKLFGEGDDQAPSILARIQAIDPSSHLLSGAALELAFDAGIGQALEAGDKATASQRLAIARKWFPRSARLLARAPAVAAMPDAAGSAATGISAAAGVSPPAAVDPSATPADTRGAQQASRLESLRRAAAAGDLDKAVDSYRQLRAVQQGNPDAGDEAGDLLAHAYLEAARASCAAGHWKAAADTMAAAMGMIGQRSDVMAANTRYQLAFAVMNAGKTPDASASDPSALQQRLGEVTHNDPAGLREMEAAMNATHALPDGSLARVIEHLRPPPAPVGPADPCARPGLAGTGRECFDTFSAGAHGPSLVVVPHGRRPFAMTRGEITVADLDVFCRATRTCAVKTGNIASSPARSIDVAFARRYAAWLSQASGHAYRLPTDDEWLVAARAGANWQGQGASCEGATTGLGRLIKGDEWKSRKVFNPWGLVDMTGSVWEWTTKGAGLALRGGSYRSGTALCSVDAMRPTTGAADGDIGFRLVRDIK